MTHPMAVQVAGSYPPAICGVGDYTQFLSRHLAAAGVTVEVWTRRDQDETAHADEVAVETGITKALTLRRCVGVWDRAGVRTLARTLGERRPAVVHLQYEIGVFDQSPAICGLALAARRAGVPLVTTFHSLDGPKRWGRAHRAALAPLLVVSRDIVVCSQRQWQALRRLPRVRDRLHLVAIGSNIVNVGNAGHKREGALLSGGASDRPLRLIYFGFVWRGKNIEAAVRALAAIVAESGGQDSEEATVRSQRAATLQIVGAVREAAYRDEVLALATALGVGDRVSFSDDLPSDQISRALHASDLALLPYPTGVSTGRGTLMAALDHGLPVVTMSTPDNLSPLFVDGDNMLLASTDAPDAFVAQAVRAARDPALRARLASGAARLAHKFTWTEVAAQILALPSYRKFVG